ncbi:MAG: hypothetical protein WC897_02970 [Candidatus Gracilibacteria bacterium]
MKKNFLFLFALLTLTGVGLYGSFASNGTSSADGNLAVELASADVPGDGFGVGDPCGFLMGIAPKYNNLIVNIDAVDPDDEQACVDQNGYFDSDGAVKKSYVYLYRMGGVTPYVIDLASSATNRVVIDQSTGEWVGRGRIISGPGFMSLANPTVWFDWACAPGTCSPFAATKNHVFTDLDLGTTDGFAWNDTLGYISFKDLSVELPPLNLDVYVDITSSTGLVPTAVDYTNAPIADGYDYWEVSAQFDDGKGGFLGEGDFEITAMTVEPVEGTQLYLNQVENSGEASYVTAENLDFGCTDAYAVYCAGIEADGSFSANVYVSSASPTSNMLGINDDDDPSLDGFMDRAGCIGVYEDRLAGGGACEAVTKEAVFYDRSDTRNSFVVDKVVLDFTYAGERAVIGDENLSCGTIISGDTVCRYTYYMDTGVNAGELSFRPRYQSTKFNVSYDGNEYDTISSDMTKAMTLNVGATVSDASDYYDSAIGVAKPVFEVNYQLDAETNNASVIPTPATNAFLIMDSDSLLDGVAECTLRTDSSEGEYFVTYGGVNMELALSYGQRLASDSCLIGVTDPAVPPDNVLSNPTVEQWVCDSAPSARFGAPSCYYTGYLPRVDAHAPALSPTVFGAINSLLDESGTFSENENVSILGSLEVVKLRNKMYAQIARYALGQDASGGSLDTDMEPSGGLKSLLNGRLIYAEGDVVVAGADGFADKTLVVIGGDVYIKGDITSGRLGVIALRSNGEGGNVYVDPSVTDLYANFFLDGSFFSDSGTKLEDGTPSWVNDEERLDGLQNQLYVNGSIVSRNTINGSVEADGEGNYAIGDGTKTGDYDVAREYDLTALRQYRLCYPLVSGVPDETQPAVVCNDGEALSDTYTPEDGMANYSPLIMEYAPADNLPVFKVESGLFN